MAGRDEVLIRIRTQGGKAAAADIKKARDQIDGIGRTAPRASGALRTIGGSAQTLGSQAATAATRIAKLSAAAGAFAGVGLAVQAAKTGAAYNKMQDSQMVAFSTMLRSEDKAKTLMSDIQALALKSPVLDAGSTGKSVQMLLNYGMTAKNALPLVEALGDASAASGKSIAEVMPQAALALGQIEGKGKLSAEELNQLTEAVGINRKRLAKELGLTSEQFAETFKPGKQIEADKAIPAIQRALEYGSKGAAKKLSKTTAGQVDQLKEIMSRELGTLTRPWYDAAGDTAGGISKILGNKKTTGGQKIRLSIDVAKKEFGPLITNARQALKEAKIGQEISRGIETYAPQMINKLANAMVEGAPKVASAFLRGFGSMGIWGQALTVGFLMKRFGAFGPAGRASGALFVTSLRAGAVGLAALGRLFGRRIGNPAGTTAAARTLAGMKAADYAGAGKGLGGKFGRAFGLAAVPAMAVLISNGIENAITEGLGANTPGKKEALDQLRQNPLYGDKDSGGGPLGKLKDAWDNSPLQNIPGVPGGRKGGGPSRGRATGGTVRPGETTLVGEKGMEFAKFPAGTKITPNNKLGDDRGSGGRTVQVVHHHHQPIVLDGKVLFDSVSKWTEIRELTH